MPKTHFSNRCQVLHDFWLFYKDDPDKGEAWDNFFDWADIGLPLAYMITEGIVTLKKGNENFIDEVWEALCGMLQVDPDANYSGVDELFAASPNERMNKDEG